MTSRLPPLNALRAFEAAARHGGFIPAAEELHVTRGAVSRHVRVLEDHLGVELFHRHARGVTLSPVGKRLLPALSESFSRIAAATAELAAEASELRILCAPATSIRWLVPKLDTFRAEVPGIELRLTTDFHGEYGFDAGSYDIAFSVEHVPGRAADLDVAQLFPIRLTPACAPALLQRLELRSPSDLSGATLLHESRSHADWTSWLSAFDAPGVSADSGHAFPNLDLATRAAVMGAGVVMADLVLCRDELDSGVLVAPFPDMICDAPDGTVCLIGPSDRWNSPKVRAFRDWATRAASGETADLPATRNAP